MHTSVKSEISPAFELLLDKLHTSEESKVLRSAPPADHRAFLSTQHMPLSQAAPVTRRVNVSESPFLHAFYCHHPLHLTIDTGAETNMLRTSLARHMGALVTKISQTALQADGHTPLTVVGETRLPLFCHGRPLTLEALVVEDLNVDILAGTPFMTSNDITVRPAKHKITSEPATSFLPQTLTPLFGQVSSLKLMPVQSCLKILHLQSSSVWIESLLATSNLLTPGLNLILSKPLAVS